MDAFDLLSLGQMLHLSNQIQALQAAAKPAEWWTPLLPGLIPAAVAAYAAIVSKASKDAVKKTADDNRTSNESIAEKTRDLTQTIADSNADLSKAISTMNAGFSENLEFLKAEFNRELKQLESRFGHIRLVTQKRISAYDEVLALVLGLDALQFEKSGNFYTIATDPEAFSEYMAKVVSMVDHWAWLHLETARLYRGWIRAVTFYYLMLIKNSDRTPEELGETPHHKKLRKATDDLRIALLMDYPRLDDIDQWLLDVQAGFQEDWARAGDH